jgi:hypothetical protein
VHAAAAGGKNSQDATATTAENRIFIASASGERSAHSVRHRCRRADSRLRPAARKFEAARAAFAHESHKHEKARPQRQANEITDVVDSELDVVVSREGIEP